MRRKRQINLDDERVSHEELTEEEMDRRELKLIDDLLNHYYRYYQYGKNGTVLRFGKTGPQRFQINGRNHIGELMNDLNLSAGAAKKLADALLDAYELGRMSNAA